MNPSWKIQMNFLLPSLESLDLSYNPISKIIAENLKANSTIKNITIDNDEEIARRSIAERFHAKVFS